MSDAAPDRPEKVSKTTLHRGFLAEQLAAAVDGDSETWWAWLVASREQHRETTLKAVREIQQSKPGE